METERINQPQGEAGPYLVGPGSLVGQCENVNMKTEMEIEENWSKEIRNRRPSNNAQVTGHPCPPCTPCTPCIPRPGNLSDIRDIAVAPKIDPWSKSANPGLQQLAQFIPAGTQPFWDTIFPYPSYPRPWDERPLDQNEAESCGDNINPSGSSQVIQQPSSNSNSNSNSKPNQRNPRRQPSKRNNGEEPPDGGRDRKRQSISAPNRKKPHHKFACPFYRLNKGIYYECLNYKLHRVGDVRQHIIRRHVNSIYCPRCGLVFEGAQTNEMRDQHIRNGECENHSVHPPGIAGEHIISMGIAANGSGTQSDVDKWYDIWRNSFPDVPCPPPEHVYLMAGFGTPTHFVNEYRTPIHSRVPMQRLTALALRYRLPPQELHVLVDALFDDMSSYFMGRMAGHESYNQGNENIPGHMPGHMYGLAAGDTQSPPMPVQHGNVSNVSDVSLSLLVPPYSSVHMSDSMLASPEDQFSPLQMNDAFNAGNCLPMSYDTPWPPQPQQPEWDEGDGGEYEEMPIQGI
ncbi:hypothetical protein F5Y11DRAFT_342898 [Daldinia sp. FL1419]|nr:hypothetical protein F5Y11DRAFT_342898 [Daldinia sp. FL1419]